MREEVAPRRFLASPVSLASLVPAAPIVNLSTVLALLLDPGLILEASGMPPDPWHRELLLAPEQFLLLNCSRQSGKSTTVAALALHRALTTPNSLVLLVAPAERQSHELFRKVLLGYQALHQPLPRHREAKVEADEIHRRNVRQP